MKRTGIFSGSFNPIHIGHLALANWLCEFERFDEVWFLVSPQNPVKDSDVLMDGEHRLQMVREAIGDYPRFRASDFEFSLPRPSYTIHTLRKLREAYPGHNFHLIIGADNWQIFDRWKDSEALLREFPIYIYPRRGYRVEIPTTCDKVFYNENTPIFEVSSTLIRQSYREGKDVRFFLPESIRHYFLNDSI